VNRLVCFDVVGVCAAEATAARQATTTNNAMFRGRTDSTALASAVRVPPWVRQKTPEIRGSLAAASG